MDTTVKAETNGLAIAALVFGVLSVLTCWTVILPIPQATLAIAFALLSRGNKKECTMAVVGTVLGIIGVVLGIVCASVLIGWVYNLITNSPYLKFIMMFLEKVMQGGGF